MTCKAVKFLIHMLIVIGLPCAGWAGALDRGPSQQRYNQAADEMIRVPGTVGMWEQDAMAVLQQAGVVPSVEYERKYKGDLAGKEGTVIDQVPGAAGITMLGSTVTITVYRPPAKGEPPGHDGNGGPYGSDGSGPKGEPEGSAPPPVNQESAPQWGDGSQPASGSGWSPPPPVPAAGPYSEPQAPMPAATENVNPKPMIVPPPTPGAPGR